MSNVMNDSDYIRNDIYYCKCCGLFYHCKTHRKVDVPFTDMPADFAIEVMIDRQNSMAGQRKKHKRRYNWMREV